MSHTISHPDAIDSMKRLGMPAGLHLLLADTDELEQVADFTVQGNVTTHVEAGFPTVVVRDEVVVYQDRDLCILSNKMGLHGFREFAGLPWKLLAFFPLQNALNTGADPAELMAEFQRCYHDRCILASGPLALQFLPATTVWKIEREVIEGYFVARCLRGGLRDRRFVLESTPTGFLVDWLE